MATRSVLIVRRSNIENTAMSTQQLAKPEPEVHVHDLSKLRGALKAIGGSMSDDWNNIIASATRWWMP